MAERPTLAVWKLASCDGCQLSLLDLEDELLAIADALDVCYFREATSRESHGPFELSLVDGSVATPDDVERIRDIRRRSRHLVALGACAGSGGIQALRNVARADRLVALVYPRPEHVPALATSKGIADYVPVDLELHGCPINKQQLLEVVSAFLHRRRPAIASHSVCVDCKLRGNVCVLVTGTPCLGPVTHAGCGALCPTYDRGCYGCYGPMEAPNPGALAAWLSRQGVPEVELVRLFRSFYGDAPAFRDQAARLEADAHARGGDD